MMSTLLDCVFPRRSLTGAEGELITTDELRELHANPRSEDTGTLRAAGIDSLDHLWAALPYEQSPLVRRAVWSFKYQRLPALAQTLALLICESLPSCPLDAVLCPVPLHWRRRFERGFNQAALLAAAIGRKKNLTVVHLLRRTHATGHQAKRGRADRLTAMRGAFVCLTKPPPHVILIDDLATTGATLDACAAALKQRGAKHVEAWVLARGGKPFFGNILQKNK